MNIVLNGNACVSGDAGSLADLLRDLKAPPDQVAVMVNDRIIPKTERASVCLRDGDRVEVLTLMGGG